MFVRRVPPCCPLSLVVVRGWTQGGVAGWRVVSQGTNCVVPGGRVFCAWYLPGLILPNKTAGTGCCFRRKGVGIAESVGGKEVRIPFAGTGVCALCCVVLTCFFCSCNPKASLCPLRGGCPGRLSGVLEWRCREGGDLDAQPSADLLGTLTYRLVWPLVVVVCV